ncbi:MAG: ABC transporter substrate-binding protein [Oscillospiraceae bacterium]|jgi:hypothetical protein|nr:ABC transporter substrate-binding protein [Oscillospiraceae bacterium]
MKKLAVILIVLCMMVALASCAGQPTGDASSAPPAAESKAETPDTPETTPDEEAPAAATGSVLRIYCWNTEFQDRFNAYFADKMPAGIEVEWVITPNEGNAYQDKLDQDLPGNEGGDNPIDIFLVEADYALKYVDTEYTLDVKADVGLTDDDLSQQYQYTKDIVTDSGGAQKGTTWQACPGLFVYRRSIAKDVLGTDDPVEVQKALADWDTFDATAAKVVEKGYKMLSGFDDAYRVFANNMSAPWVDADKVIHIDSNLWRWVKQTKDYYDNGYTNGTSLWSAEWSADQGPDGKVFGFFYSTWGINFTLLGNSLADPDGPKEVGNGIYGDYAVCEGPENWYWGGSWICAARGSDNLDLVREVMKTITCDAATMKQITLDTEDYTDNMAAMNELANDPDYGSPFLAGQNHIALFAAAAPGIDMSKVGPYDQGLTESFQAAFADYFRGTVDEQTALNNFFTSVQEKYPALALPPAEEQVPPAA